MKIENDAERPRPGEQVGVFHLPDCGGRLNRITGYGSDVVNCEKCGSEYPVEERFGELHFTGGRNA